MSSQLIVSKSELKVRPERRRRVLKPPSLSPGRVWNELRALAEYRDLLYTLTVHRIKVRYKQSALGIGWAVLQPLSLMLIYTVVFTLIARMPTNGDTPYPVLLYSALLVWSFFSTALTSATNGLVSHSQLVTKVYFPREILPLTYIFAGLFDILIAAPVLVGLMWYYGVAVTIYALYAIPILLILTSFMTAVSLFLSAIQVRFRDVGMAMPLVLQVWMFASPVVYPLSAVPERFRSLYMLNPMAGVVENFRRVLVEGMPPDPYQIAVSGALALILLPLAYIFFKNVEATIADII
jgi:lipopolysaccharide transport system permease protein